MGKMNPAEIRDRLKAAVTSVESDMNADVILINSPMWEPCPNHLQSLVDNRVRRPSAFVVLVTLGGDAHAAYAMARTLQRAYPSGVTVCIAGDCYSAGTLLVLGANDVVMADRGRLGPLDVQLLKKDSLGERLSGLTLGISLGELQQHAHKAFTGHLASLLNEFQNSISLKTAMDIAVRMTTESFSEVYRQIDPVKMGEDARALHIADHYGELLQKNAQNLKAGALTRLLEGYPAHDCIIDRDEAQDLFERIAEPTDNQKELIAALGDAAVEPGGHGNNVLVVALSKEPNRETDNNGTNPKGAGKGAVAPGAGSSAKQGNSGVSQGTNGAAGSKNDLA